MKNFNKGVVWASKYLSSKGITKVKLPANGFDPEIVTRYIKGASLVNLGVQSAVRIKNKFDEIGDSPGRVEQPVVVPAPTPSPSPSPSPQPSPKPSSKPFHTALAPAV